MPNYINCSAESGPTLDPEMSQSVQPRNINWESTGPIPGICLAREVVGVWAALAERPAAEHLWRASGCGPPPAGCWRPLPWLSPSPSSPAPRPHAQAAAASTHPGQFPTKEI